MKNIAAKVDNISTLGDDGFNSLMEENENAVLSSGQTLDPSNESTPDPDTSQMARAMTMASQSADFYTDGGVADAYVLSAVGSWEQPAAYRDGMRVRFIPGNENTAASTINVSTIGVVALVDEEGVALVAGAVPADVQVTAVYHGVDANFRITNVAGGVNTGSLVFISEQVASTDSSIDFTDLDGTYKTYVIELINVVPVTDQPLHIRTSVNNGGSFDSSDYQWAVQSVDSNASIVDAGNPSDAEIKPFGTQFVGGEGVGESLNITCKLMDFASTAFYKQIKIDGSYTDTAGDVTTVSSAGMRSDEAAVNAIRFFFAADDIASGTFKLYGVK